MLEPLPKKCLFCSDTMELSNKPSFGEVFRYFGKGSSFFAGALGALFLSLFPEINPSNRCIFQKLETTN